MTGADIDLLTEDQAISDDQRWELISTADRQTNGNIDQFQYQADCAFGVFLS